jgi:hypothetical protein
MTAWRRRSWRYALAAAAAVAIFSGFLAIPWPGHPASPGLMAASDQYVLYGLALLAATALDLARKRAAACRAARKPGIDRATPSTPC